MCAPTSSVGRSLDLLMGPRVLGFHTQQIKRQPPSPASAKHPRAHSQHPASPLSLRGHSSLTLALLPKFQNQTKYLEKWFPSLPCSLLFSQTSKLQINEVIRKTLPSFSSVSIPLGFGATEKDQKRYSSLQGWTKNPSRFCFFMETLTTLYLKVRWASTVAPNPTIKSELHLPLQLLNDLLRDEKIYARISALFTLPIPFFPSSRVNALVPHYTGNWPQLWPSTNQSPFTGTSSISLQLGDRAKHLWTWRKQLILRQERAHTSSCLPLWSHSQRQPFTSSRYMGYCAFTGNEVSKLPKICGKSAFWLFHYSAISNKEWSLLRC